MIATIEYVNIKEKGPSSIKVNGEYYKFWNHGKTTCNGKELLKKGAVVELTIKEVDEGEYGMQKYVVAVSQASQEAKASARAGDDRDRLIVNQSSLDRAVQYMTSLEGHPAKIGDVLKCAEVLSEWVWNFHPKLGGATLQEAAKEVLGDNPDFDPFAD